METLLNKHIVRYLMASGFIVTLTQVLFFVLLLFIHRTAANFIALTAMLYPGLWLNKRFVFNNKEPFDFVEVKEFLSTTITPTIISPIVLLWFANEPNYVLSLISLSVFGFFWLLRFYLENKRWNKKIKN